jgi:hypothetical protein
MLLQAGRRFTLQVLCHAALNALSLKTRRTVFGSWADGCPEEEFCHIPISLYLLENQTSAKERHRVALHVTRRIKVLVSEGKS